VANTDRLFFRNLSYVLALLVLAGFGPSYYFRSVVAEPVELTGLMALHGLVFTAWTVLLVVQTSLVTVGNLVWHRRLGYSSVVLAVLMVVFAAALALERTQTWLEDPSFPAGEVLQFLAIPTTTVLYFAGMYAAALGYRQQPAVHKRLMVLASLDIFTPAVARLPYLTTLSSTYHYLVIDLALLALVVHDWRSSKRVHPATLWGGAVLVTSQVGRELLAQTDTWMTIAVWLLDLANA
jgi:hypothetical protein